MPIQPTLVGFPRTFFAIAKGHLRTAIRVEPSRVIRQRHFGHVPWHGNIPALQR